MTTYCEVVDCKTIIVSNFVQFFPKCWKCIQLLKACKYIYIDNPNRWESLANRTIERDNTRSQSIDRQELRVEPVYLQSTVDEMNLQSPVLLLTLSTS